MDLLDSILKAQGGGAVGQLASQFGLREDQAASAIQSLMPALAGGLQHNISQVDLRTCSARSRKVNISGIWMTPQL